VFSIDKKWLPCWQDRFGLGLGSALGAWLRDELRNFSLGPEGIRREMHSDSFWETFMLYGMSCSVYESEVVLLRVRLPDHHQVQCRACLQAQLLLRTTSSTLPPTSTLHLCSYNSVIDVFFAPQERLEWDRTTGSSVQGSDPCNFCFSNFE
jgi:hypothetical protein